jgi:hypothetical protein
MPKPEPLAIRAAIPTADSAIKLHGDKFAGARITSNITIDAYYPDGPDSMVCLADLLVVRHDEVGREKSSLHFGGRCEGIHQLVRQPE